MPKTSSVRVTVLSRLDQSRKAEVGQMRFAFCIEQNVSRFDVAMQNAVLVRVVNVRATLAISSAARRIGIGSRLDNLIKLTAFDELHAEVARAIALADFVDGNDTGMIEAGSGFRFPTKTLQMRFGSPMAEANHFERDGAIETFLPRAINHALAATTDYLQQFVIAKIGERLCRSRHFPFDPVIARHHRGRGRSTPATGSCSEQIKPVSNRHAVQRPSGASAKISAPHFRQTLGALLMMGESPSRSSSCTARISGIRYVRNTAIKWRSSSSISLAMATV